MAVSKLKVYKRFFPTAQAPKVIIYSIKKINATGLDFRLRQKFEKYQKSILLQPISRKWLLASSKPQIINGKYVQDFSNSIFTLFSKLKKFSCPWRIDCRGRKQNRAF